jgi:hypothetical protein
MTLGIAIPTYSGHLHHLPLLLDTIQKSTVLPKKVSISCSSQSENIILEKEYGFEIIINTTNEYKNPSQNRNISANYLDTDIISFIDGDDLPHSQRNEFIMKSFDDSNVVAVLHDYHQSININENFIYSKYDNLGLLVNYIDTVFPSGFTGNKTPNHEYAYHHAHISLRNEIFKKTKYNESQEFLYREDSIYVRDLVTNGNKISYISNKLSQYIK